MELSAQLIWWIVGINSAFALALAFWVRTDAALNRRPALAWAAGAFVIGSLFGAPGGLLCYLAYYSSIERSHNAELWAFLSAVFGLPGYIAYYTYDDCKCRGMNLYLWPALAFVLAFPAILPWIIFQMFFLAFRRPVTKPTITVASIRERYARAGILEPSDGMLLDVRNLKKYFPVRKGVFARVREHVKAVDDVSLFVKPGETLGLVGESGCGKTTLGRTILSLTDATSGSVFFDGLAMDRISGGERRVLRKDMQIIFQDPFGSLNPRMSVESIISEPMAVHKLAERDERRDKVAALIERVGLSVDHLGRYPHEFSGGQRQRIGIARALALEPRFIVCDEPVSALDVSIQAQIINLLKDLREEYGLSYLFIAHDLRVVENISDRVAVMYLGKIVELAASDQLYGSARHPYTVALMSAIPVPDPARKRTRIILPGDVPSPINPPSGCSFHPRCFNALPVCSTETPQLLEHEPGHFFACHNPVPAK
jgi:oligopeptide/dipeptide ABC transporter ATP-binding protein